MLLQRVSKEGIMFELLFRSRMVVALSATVIIVVVVNALRRIRRSTSFRRDALGIGYR